MRILSATAPWFLENSDSIEGETCAGLASQVVRPLWEPVLSHNLYQPGPSVAWRAGVDTGWSRAGQDRKEIRAERKKEGGRTGEKW